MGKSRQGHTDRQTGQDQAPEAKSVEEIDRLQAKYQGLEAQEAAQAQKRGAIHEEVLRLEAVCKLQDAKTFGDKDGNDEGDGSDFESEGDGDVDTNGGASQATGQPRQERSPEGGSDQGPNRRAKRRCNGQVALGS